MAKLKPGDMGYRYGELNPCSVRYLFDVMIDEEKEMDKEFDWVLVNNMVVLPVEYTRVRVGDGFGADVGYDFQYELLHELDFDIMSLIAEKVIKVKGKPNKTKHLISAIWISVTMPSDDTIEILRDFK